MPSTSVPPRSSTAGEPKRCSAQCTSHSENIADARGTSGGSGWKRLVRGSVWMSTIACRSASWSGRSSSRSVSMSVNTSAKLARGSDKMTPMTELPLVLLHAFPLDSRMWNAVREPLASHLRVITPDQRGLGRSPLPETDREPGLEDAARDVVALLDRLELDRVVLGGCSMGGYLAMAVLRLAPERVGELVLIDTKATPHTPESAQSRLDVAQRVEDEGTGGWLAEANLPNLLAGSTREQRPDVVETVREII